MQFRVSFVVILVACAAFLGTGCLSTEIPRPQLALTAEDRVPDPSCSAHWVAGVRGRVVDEAGLPVVGAQVQMCLRLADHTQLCLDPSDTTTGGWFPVVLPPHARCLSRVIVRAVAVGTTGTYATSFLESPMNPIEGVLDVPQDIELYPLESPEALAPMGDADAARTVRFPSGFELDVTPNALDFVESYDRLAVAPVPMASAPDFMGQIPGLDGVFALGPEVASLPGAPFRFVPPAAWAEGARVELFVLGGIYTELSNGTLVEEGQFARFGTATVSGGMVRSDPGSELPYFTWLGYRVLR